MRRTLLALTAVFTLFPSTVVQAGEGDIIVQREPGLDSSERRELREQAGVELVATLPVERTELVQPADGDVAAALAELNAEEGVVFAEPDRRVRTTAPNDFWWSALWALSNDDDTDIDAPEAWLRSVGTGVTVAVVDTGINAAHEDLAGQTVEGWDFVSDDPDPQDGNGHGTHVAGTIAATGFNGAGVVGVAPEAKVMPLRALDDAGEGWMSDIAAAFAYAGDRGVKIVNASLGGDYSKTLKQVIADHPDTLYVVAAGNENVDNDVPGPMRSFPCALPEANILCVGASTSSDTKAEFSSYGAATVDLSAPGVKILSAWHTSPTAYRFLQGTSMATPHAAGTAALALAAAPDASAADLKAALMSSVEMKPALDRLSVTCGRLNADAAVAAITGDGSAADPCPAPPAPPAPPTPPAPTSNPTPPPVATPAPEQPAPPAPPAPAPPAAPPAPPAPPAPVAPAPSAAPAPLLAKVSVRGSLASARSKVRVRYSLSTASRVRFTITRRGSKRPLASWTRRSRAGANSTTIMRRLPTGHTLKRGSYTLSIGLSATASSRRSLRVR